MCHFLLGIQLILLTFSSSWCVTTASTDVTCNATTSKCNCPEDPLTERYPDPRDKTCRNYYLCHLGHAFHKECGARLVFHPTKRVCMSRDRVTESLCAQPVTCDKNGYIEDPEDCTKYYLCFYRKPFHYGCTDGSTFVADQSKCVPNKAIARDCSKSKSKTFQKFH